jgi:replication factor C subunit 1
MFTTKYRPKLLKKFIGNQQVLQPFIKWLLDWDSSNKTKCALVSGLNGVGKSLLVELILNKHSYNIINLTTDEENSKKNIIANIKPLIKTTKTINGLENVLVISDIDSITEHGFISIILEFIKETQIPIICICDNRYEQSIKPILAYCFDIKLSPPTLDEVYPLIYDIVQNEQIKITKSGVNKLYKQSNGDIRNILNTLQIYNKTTDTSKNIQSYNVFDTTTKILSQETELEEKNRYYWMSRDIHTLMVQENYINCTLNTMNDIVRLNNMAYAADSLSDTDIINSTFNFELEPYIAFNTIKATTKCTKKGYIKFPQFLGRLASINKNKREKINYETTILDKIEVDHKKPDLKKKPKTEKEPKPEKKLKPKKEPKPKKDSKTKKETK